MGAAKVGGLAGEVIVTTTSPRARVGALAGEALITNPSPRARVGALAGEVLVIKLIRLELGVVTETDEAPLIAVKGKLRQVAETDVVLPVQLLRRPVLGQQSETNEFPDGLPLVRSKRRTLGLQTETDLAQRSAPTTVVPIGLLLETELTQPIRYQKTTTPVQVFEVDEPLEITAALPINHTFDKRDDVSEESGYLPTTRLNQANTEAGEYTNGLAATLWWEWTAPADYVPEEVTWSFSWAGQSATGGGSLRVYAPATLGVIPASTDIVVEHNPTGASGTATVTLIPVAGTTYYIQQGIREKAGTQAYLNQDITWRAPATPPTPADPAPLNSKIRALVKTTIEMPAPTVVDGVPEAWTPTSVTRTTAGFLVVMMGPAGGAMTDVTYYRGIPTVLENFSFLDPFSYGSATLTFSQISIFDDIDGLGFLGTEDNPANIDIWWFDAAPGTDFRDPLTNQVSLTYGAGTLLWEGFVASRELTDAGLQVQCQGALFQADYYKQKPFYPRRPFVMERLIYEVLHPEYGPGNQEHWMGKPHLRTAPVLTRFPAGWSKITPPREEGEPNLYTPVIPPNRLWTGFTTRNTGSWEATLTGYIADILAVLYTTDDSGVTPGNQWTLRCEAGRQPVLEIRDKARPPDFEFWAGQPGVELSLSADFTTIENSLYGEGTGVDGVAWRNSFVTGAWNRTDYDPLVADPKAYPPVAALNPSLDTNFMVHESKTTYGSGMDLVDAEKAAEKRYALAATAGWSGTVTVKVDPAAFVRWQIKAGMTMRLKGLAGSGTTGINFHIAEAVHNLATGEVSLKVDTKYRDLLTLEEVRARTIDPLTPSKLLQVNKRSVMVEDILAPWDYYQGAGYIPAFARSGKNRKEGIEARYNFFEGMKANVRFPWQSWTTTRPPSAYTIRADGFSRGPYVRVDANNSASKQRWSFVPVLTAQKFTIRRIEVAAYDASGNVLEIPFHLSFFAAKPTAALMPRTGSDFSPFTPGHFEEITATGVPTPDAAPPQTFIIGWGNSEQFAGHSPGLSSEGQPATGLLIDEATWGHDNSTPENINWDQIAAADGEDQTREAITIWAAFYAEYTSDVYFLGRMYRQEQA